MSKVVTVNANTWEREVLGSDRPVVVDFWHDMCGWCNKLNPIIEQLPERYGDRAKFVKVNILESGENREIAMNLGVLGTPTLKFFCDGRVVGEIVGFRPLDRLVEEIDGILAKKDECIERSTPLES